MGFYPLPLWQGTFGFGAVIAGYFEPVEFDVLRLRFPLLFVRTFHTLTAGTYRWLDDYLDHADWTVLVRLFGTLRVHFYGSVATTLVVLQWADAATHILSQ